MSRIDDLYKESGIKPGGVDKEPKKTTGQKGSNYIISIIISVVIFAGIFVFFQTDSAKHSGLSIRNSAIFIVGLVYLVNFFIKLFIKMFRNKD